MYTGVLRFILGKWLHLKMALGIGKSFVPMLQLLLHPTNAFK